MKCKPIEQVNYLAGHKSIAMTKCYDHAHDERYGGAIEALDNVAKRSSAEVLAGKRAGSMRSPRFARRPLSPSSSPRPAAGTRSCWLRPAG